MSVSYIYACCVYSFSLFITASNITCFIGNITSFIGNITSFGKFEIFEIFEILHVGNWKCWKLEVLEILHVFFCFLLQNINEGIAACFLYKTVLTICLLILPSIIGKHLEMRY